MSTQTGPTVTEVCGPVCAGAEASLAGSGGSSPEDAGGVAVDLGQEVFDSAGGGTAGRRCDHPPWYTATWPGRQPAAGRQPPHRPARPYPARTRLSRRQVIWEPSRRPEERVGGLQQRVELLDGVHRRHRHAVVAAEPAALAFDPPGASWRGWWTSTRSRRSRIRRCGTMSPGAARKSSPRRGGRWRRGACRRPMSRCEPLADEGEHLAEFGGVGEIEVHLGSWHRVLLGWCSAGGRAGGLLGVLLSAQRRTGA